MPLSNDEFSYALGAMGSTRKKLARAADCIMEYVGGVAIVAGFKSERRRAKDYLSWLLQQRRGVVSVDTRDRDDVTVVEVPRDSVGASNFPLAARSPHTRLLLLPGHP